MSLLKLNAELFKKIEEVIQNMPKPDEDTVVEKLVGTMRLKREAIKSGVKEYFRNKIVKVPEPDKKEPPLTIVELDEPKKKAKKGKLELEFEDHPSYQFEKMGGIEETLVEIKNNIFLPIEKKDNFALLGVSIFKGFLISGPVGSGKTYLCNCLLSYMKRFMGFNPYSVHSGLLTASDAEENLKKLFQTAKENEPAVIFIDEIDLLSSKETSKRPQGSPIFALLNEIDNVKWNNIIVIGTTSNPEKIDTSLKKLNRLEKNIYLNMSSELSRQKVLHKLLEEVKHNLTNEEVIDISQRTPGFMASDLVLLIKEAGLSTILFSGEHDALVNHESLQKSIKLVQPVLKKEGFTDVPTTTLDDVGGLKKLKDEIAREIIIPMGQQDRFKELNFDVQSGGVLLYGPPGCGKTMLAKAIANAVRANFIIVKGPELLNKYVGESEQAVREVFGRAQRAAPCVIFFDEFDALAPKRSDQGNQVTERVVNTLLTALDGVEERKMVFVIAATNRKDMIDEATLRAGRIQKHLYVPQPNEEERAEILYAITKKIKISKSITFDEIARKTEGFSGADLKFLVKEAVVNAVMNHENEVSMLHFNKSLEELLEAKKKNTLHEKVHEQELKDNEENDQFTFHAQRPKLQKEEMEVDKNMEMKEKSKDIFSEFLEFLAHKKRL